MRLSAGGPRAAGRDRSMKPDAAVRQWVARIAAGVLALVIVMLGVYAALGKFSTPVLLGALFGGVLAVANQFAMGLTVQSSTDRAASEGEKSEQESQQFQNQMSAKMKASYSMRTVAMFGLAILGIAVLKFDALATILPLVFPRIIILFMQLRESAASRRRNNL